MRKPLRYFIIALIFLGLGACETENEPDPGMEDLPTVEDPTEPDVSLDEEKTEDGVDEAVDTDVTDEAGESEEVAHDFDDKIEETIEIEGMEESIALNLYDYVSAPYITYVPADLLAEAPADDRYTFYANYEGEKLEEINMQVQFFGDDVTEQPRLDDTESDFAKAVGEMEPVEEEFEWYDWTIEEYQSADGSRYALLGEHEGDYFIMILNSEPLYSEGFIPRAQKIIEHFYWTDTGEYLVKE